MTTQALTLPVDIPWRRFVYAADMIDTNFGDLALPPKWRSSMAVYYYVVPREQTAETYPDGRIVYLRLTCSITGWNPSEDLQGAINLDEIGDQLDDWQKAAWEVIASVGWAKAYWACRGAIGQIAVYPHSSDHVGVDDYPFIFDFEPKKRELYETHTESGEFLSGSSDKLNVQKGNTTTDSTEESDITTGGGLKFAGFGASVSGEWGTRKRTGTESMDMRTTDTSRERRETTSHSTTMNQMYQLFNGYHLGTNRAVFVIAPRPHTVSASESAQAEFNLVRGDRELEGLQDMFLVVHVPAKLKGLCVQANLDTGHDIDLGSMALEDGAVVILEDRPLVVTRRVIQNCGLFDEAGNLVPTGVPTPPSKVLPPIVFEDVIPRPRIAFDDLLSQALPSREPRMAAMANGTREARINAADQMNLYQRKVQRKMLDGFSTGRYKPRPFVETDTFRRLGEITLRNVKLAANQLIKLGYMSRNALRDLRRGDVQIHTVGDLFTKQVEESHAINLTKLHDLQRKLMAAVLNVAKRGRESVNGR